jgi:hypothetical protein
MVKTRKRHSGGVGWRRYFKEAVGVATEQEKAKTKQERVEKEERKKAKREAEERQRQEDIKMQAS